MYAYEHYNACNKEKHLALPYYLICAEHIFCKKKNKSYPSHSGHPTVINFTKSHVRFTGSHVRDVTEVVQFIFILLL